MTPPVTNGPDEPTRQLSVSTAPPSAPRRWWSAVPHHLGRARTSTVVLALLFVGLYTLYLYIGPTDQTAATTPTQESTVQTPAPSDPPLLPTGTTTAPAPTTTPGTSAPTPTPPAETTGEVPAESAVPTPTPTPTEEDPTPTATAVPTATGAPGT